MMPPGFITLQLKCKMNGKPYIDKDFPADKQSLIDNWDDKSADVVSIKKEWKTYEWIRASEIPSLNDDEGKLAVFAGNIEPADIKQGALGDCYFLSVLSVLTEKPDRVRILFETDLVNPEGIFGLNMTKNGIKQMVVIDDFIPCKNKEPVFSSANGNELWVILLEKAWAKLHGSYERIIGGQSHLTFRDLTGAPSFEFETKDEDAWAKIADGDKKDFIMAAGIAQDDEEEAAKLKALGLVGQHSYGLIAVAEVTDKNKKNVKLVQLRNPWGNFEWMGDWGDTSKCWTPELKKQLNHTEDASDGTFWMSFSDFSTYFSRIQMCKYIDKSNFVNLVS
jgi:hypothetical protein